MGFHNCSTANWASWGFLTEIKGRKPEKRGGMNKGKWRRKRIGGRRGREPEVSLEVPMFDVFSILMASTDGSIEL